MMFGMERNKIIGSEEIKEPGYKFTGGNSRIFITGVPLSGKSTIAPLVASEISDCGIQNMDILRLTAQMIEEVKPVEERNPFANYGSCDSYVAIGDGSYSPENLVLGYREYSKIVTQSLDFILPKLEVQGAKDMVFEGVQLMPEIVKNYLNPNARLIVVTSNAQTLKTHAQKLFAGEDWLMERYSTDKLLMLQEEILRQTKDFPADKLLIVENTQTIASSTADVMNYLLRSGVIEAR